MNLKYTISAGILWMIFILSGIDAQNILVGHFTFENCEIRDVTGNNPNIVIGAAPQCDCGIIGTALNFDGQNQYFEVDSQAIAPIFTRSPFSVSFNFKPNAGSGLMTIFSKKRDCLSNEGITMRYNAATREIQAELAESANNRLLLRATLPNDRCWHHVVLTRIGTTHRLYINNQLIQELRSPAVINLTNLTELTFGSGPCVGSTEVPLNGLIDDLRFYSRDLFDLEIAALFFNQDKVNNRDTTIFLGGQVEIMAAPNCADSYSWFPQTNVSNPLIADPILRPEESTSYFVNFNYQGCIARDTVIVTVIDPSLLDCEKLPMPNAFTPNTDGLNELYFISNPFSFDELLSFEIFERNGGKVFYTNNKQEGWDGSFRGSPMPTGAYLYMIKFRCGEKDISKTGTFQLIR
jgi:gliding motility-associated-like protein